MQIMWQKIFGILHLFRQPLVQQLHNQALHSDFFMKLQIFFKIIYI